MTTASTPIAHNSKAVNRILRLIKEYRPHLEERLKSLDWFLEQLRKTPEEASESARTLAEQRWQVERPRIHRLFPGVERFIREMSQLLDHGELTDFERIELELRLADLEAITAAMRAMMNRLS